MLTITDYYSQQTQHKISYYFEITSL